MCWPHRKYGHFRRLKTGTTSGALVRSAFRKYYFYYDMLLKIPEHLDHREFGYVPFGTGMIRHLLFRNRGDLNATLVQDVPANVYCSKAIQEKQWLGAGLIIDIDVKDLHLPNEQSLFHTLSRTSLKLLRVLSKWLL